MTIWCASCARRTLAGTVERMIGYLNGTALSESLVDVGGVGYLVHVPAPLVPGERVELLVTTVVREDAIVLYGFRTAADQSMFGAVNRVAGVGPATALALLATLGTDGIATAVAGKDETALSRVKGVGKRTATAIAATCIIPEGLLAIVDPRVADIAVALTGLGFDRVLAQASARIALDESPDGDDADLLSRALAAAATKQAIR